MDVLQTRVVKCSGKDKDVACFVVDDAKQQLLGREEACGAELLLRVRVARLYYTTEKYNKINSAEVL